MIDGYCGDCLHALNSHDRVSDTLMYCAICLKTCDDVDCHYKHKPSGTIVQDGIVYKVGKQ